MVETQIKESVEYLKEKNNAPYESNAAYMKDLFSLLKLWLLGEKELSIIFQYLKNREQATLEKGFIPVFLKLCMDTKASEFEKICILLALSVYEDLYFSERYVELVEDTECAFPTIATALDLYRCLQYENKEDLLRILGNTASISQSFLYWLEDTKRRTPMKRMIRASEGMYRAVYGQSIVANTKSKVCYLVDAIQKEEEALVNRELLPKLTSFLKTFWNSGQDKDCIMNLYGEKGMGRKFILRKITATLSMPGLVVVDMKKLSMLSIGEQTEYIIQARLEVLVENRLLVLEHLSEERGEEVQQLIKALTNKIKVSILLSEKCMQQVELPDYLIFPISFPEYSHEESVALWKHFIEPYSNNKLQLDIYANNYHYTAEQIMKLSKLARMESMLEGKEKIEEKHLLRALRKHKTESMTGYAVLQDCVFHMEDLILDENEKRVLSNLCNQVKYRHVVNEEWGMAGKLPYGKGISILIYGPPGTGKTMSAQVIANELKLDLYRVDLSQIMSKYIGETEKYIAETFLQARKNSGILFFDEADSMFTKRTEVSDSKDKYANNETAFLLQKIEEYDGITILATNYINNIDNAFKRRFQYIMGINAPDAKLRLKIWQSVFPEKAPLAENINLEALAEQFEFTGSSIKSIARAACYLAAADEEKIEKNIYWKL